MTCILQGGQIQLFILIRKKKNCIQCLQCRRHSEQSEGALAEIGGALK